MRGHITSPGMCYVMVLALCLTLVAISGCRVLRLPLATIQDENDWLTEGGSPSRIFARDISLEPPLSRAWKYNAGAAFGPGSPLVVNDVVVVATRKGEVHAIDIRNGKSRGVVGMGESIDGTPVIDERGIIYVPVSWGRRGILAYDLIRGSTLWKDKRVPVEAGLLLMNGRLIVADVQSRVTAYDARIGEQLWELTLSDRAVVHAAPVQIGPDELLVGDDGGVVTAIDAVDGTVIWEHALPGPVYSPPAFADGVVYIPTTRGVLAAMDAATGAELYLFDAGHAEARLSTPAIAADLLLTAGSNGVLYAVNRVTGDLVWSHASGEAFGGPPLVAGDVVYVADMAESLRAFDLDSGELLWETELEGRVKSAMAIADQGLVVLTEPRDVVFYRSEGRHAASR